MKSFAFGKNIRKNALKHYNLCSFDWGENK